MKYSRAHLVPIGLLLLLCVFPTMAHSNYTKYRDPKQPVKERVADLMSRMTLAEKIAQMAQVDHVIGATPEAVRDYSLGSILHGGNDPAQIQATPEEWLHMVNGYQKGALSSRLGIPMFFGIDALHGHNNVYRATIFPHNIGLGVTR